jgi:hypothetical protein
MAVRNFWIEGFIDGRNTDVTGGPKSKEGGMTVNIYQRNCGSIEKALRIECLECNGNLRTKVFADGKCVYELETER